VRTALSLAIVLAALGAAAPAQAAGPLQTAVYVQPSDIPSSDSAANLVFKRIRQAGATAVRLTVSWREVAPAERPADFHPAKADDPAYDWTFADREIELAVANGLQPLVTVLTAPTWAEQGSRGRGNMKVSASALGQFATAITTRYGGSFKGLPRVRTWLVWNEPNLSTYLAPQVSGKQLVGASRYRSMVNAFAAAAHTVDRSNVVVAGLVAPFTFRNDPGPLRFMRAVLCMSSGKNPKPTCSAKVQFDVWSVHPYTSGGPRHHAFSPNDVSLGDLPTAHRLLSAAVRARHIVSSRPVQFWVTEFSWDSKPPDSKGVPLKLEAQWISEGLYRMWQAGISLVTWFLLRDETRPSPYQSGLYFHSGKAKPALDAFRFPFVAFRQQKGTFVWGRTPAGKAGSVVVERSVKHGWKRVATLRTNQSGIFSRVLPLRLPAAGFMRARGAGAKSIAFPLRRPPDRFVSPFGS
jgi:hypothetical protein